MTVFDPSTLHQLVDDPADRAFALGLAATYRKMLPGRVERVMAAVLGPDPDEAMDAVLSLRVSSTMTGASEMSELASSVEADIRADDLPAARAQSFLLPAAAERLAEAIDAYLATNATNATSTTSTTPA